MRAVVVNDLHFGARRGRSVFEQELQHFVEEVFLPTLDSTGAEAVFVVGDVFDDRVAVKTRSYDHAKRFFDALEERGRSTFVSLGNHDVVFRNRLRPNSLHPLLDGYRHVRLIEEPTDVSLGPLKCLVLPWMCDENEASCLDQVSRTDARVLLMHGDVAGTQVLPGVVSTHGYDPSLFSKFDIVLNGHIHSRSRTGNVLNMGTQYQSTWADCGEVKGLHVLHEDGSLDFVANPRTLFAKFYVDDGLVEGVELSTWLEDNAQAVDGKFVRFVCTSDLPDDFVRGCAALAEEVEVVDARSQAATDSVVQDLVAEGGTTEDVLRRAVDEWDTDLDKATLLRLLMQLRVEAVSEWSRE